MRTVRPSLLDLRFAGDVWVNVGHEDVLTVSLGDYPLARLDGSTLDVPSLNGMLDRIRHRRPRWRCILGTNAPA